MGFWSRLFGNEPKKTVRLEGDGDYECEVAGESNYQAALDRICGGKTEEGHNLICEAVLYREYRNPNDPNAVAVTIGGTLVGYLPRPHAAAMAVIFKKHNLAAAQCGAIIVGGWTGRRGRKAEGHYGVRLDIPVNG